jgi:hypothetical protein
LGKSREELSDFIEMYENTYMEKEKLWEYMGLKGAVRESADREIVRKALEITLGSNAIFCVELLIDYLYMDDLFPGDPYPNKINTPGTVSKTNWSLTVPVSLEELLKSKICAKIKGMAEAAGRE